jgi:enediyne biosynthesis protein E4
VNTVKRLVVAILLVAAQSAPRTSTPELLAQNVAVRYVPDDLQETSWLHGNGLAIADVDGDGRTDIYFVNQVGGNQLWRNTGGGRFEDITASSGVAVPDKVSVSAGFADIDNDGDVDLYVTTVRAGNVLFENDGKGRFRDISAAAGLNYAGHSSAALFFDYNRDGRVDLLLVNVGRYTTETTAGGAHKYHVAFEDAFAGHLQPARAERSVLYRNEGGNRFVDVSKQAGLVDASWTGDASAVDVNDDGYPDVYLTNMQGDDQYYENVGGKQFVRKSRVVFPRTSWGSMGIKVFDADNDGRLDIFVTDMHSDMSQTIGPEREKLKSEMKWPVSFRGSGKTSIWGNSIFVKDGAGKYHEASDAFGLENYCPWGPSVGDLNADGFDDVFITAGMNYPERYMINSVKLNDGGKRFADAEFVLGVEPRSGGIATPFFELDATGADKGHKDAVGERGRIAIWGARGSRSAAIFDIDDDGDLDVVTNEFNAAPMVLTSNLMEKTRVRYLSVRLTGTTSNRSALGTMVKVTAGGSSYVKVMDGNTGYLSHGVYPLYFGLGSAESVDSIEVTWPSGRKQLVPMPVKVNTVLDVREGV